MDEKELRKIDKSGVSPTGLDLGQTQPGEDSKHVETVANEESDYYSSLEFKARERRVVRKMDFYIAPLMGSFNFISYLDRSNIGFAATQVMVDDLKLKASDLNVGISIFYVSLRWASCQLDICTD